MISIQNVSKSYGGLLALDSINLEVEKGELFGLIGPDGAGKTSLIRILATLIKPSSGVAKVNGLDVVGDFMELRKHLGYMPGRFSLYQDLSILENLQLFATIFGTTIEENYDLIQDIYVQIEPFRHRRAGALSGGMKQKLALSCALIHKPEVLLLDEPTTGVDAVSRREFWDMLDRLKARGITIFVSTPYMDEASRCDRVALIDGGKIMQIDSPEAIVEAFDRDLLAVKASDTYRLLQDLREFPESYSVFPFGESVHVTDKRSTAHPEDIKAFLHERGHQNLVVEAIPPNIEDCFMALMNKES